MLKYNEISAKSVRRALMIAHDSKRAKIRAAFFKDEYRILRREIVAKNVLVIGSGLGHDSIMLCEKNKMVTGIEMIKPFITESKKQAKKLKLKNLKFIYGDFMKFKPTKKFEAVVLNMGTIGNFDNPTKILKKLLSFGGTLYFDYYRPEKKALLKRKKMYEQESWTKLHIKGKKVYNEAGFETYSFSKQYIKSILETLKADATFYTVTDIAYLVAVTKK